MTQFERILSFFGIWLERWCNKGVQGCYCRVGWPRSKQCPDCRWPKGETRFRDSYCECPPRELPF